MENVKRCYFYVEFLHRSFYRSYTVL